MSEPIDVPALFEKWADDGLCPMLVYDDDGHWAVSFDGYGPVIEEDIHKDEVGVTAVVQPDQWRDTVREALEAAVAARAEHNDRLSRSSENA